MVFDTKVTAKIIPEIETKLSACFAEAEKGVVAVTAEIAAGSGANFFVR